MAAGGQHQNTKDKDAPAKFLLLRGKSERETGDLSDENETKERKESSFMRKCASHLHMWSLRMHIKTRQEIASLTLRHLSPSVYRSRANDYIGVYVWA